MDDFSAPCANWRRKGRPMRPWYHFHDIDVIFTDLPSILVHIFALAARRATATNNQKLPKTFRNLYNEIA